jgi:hypothetical protein
MRRNCCESLFAFPNVCVEHRTGVMFLIDSIGNHAVSRKTDMRRHFLDRSALLAVMQDGNTFDLDSLNQESRHRRLTLEEAKRARQTLLSMWPSLTFFVLRYFLVPSEGGISIGILSVTRIPAASRESILCGLFDIRRT